MFGYVGEIRLFGGGYEPADWMFCQGQVLLITKYQALFSLIGFTYGGDGKTNFVLPDLRSRVVLSVDPRQKSLALGAKTGSENTMLSAYMFPNHTHAIACNGTTQNANTPRGNFPAIGQATGSPPRTTPIDLVYATTTDQTVMDPAMVVPAGTGFLGSINTIQPVLGLNYIICVSGYYPVPPDSEAQA